MIANKKDTENVALLLSLKYNKTERIEKSLIQIILEMTIGKFF